MLSRNEDLSIGLEAVNDYPSDLWSIYSSFDCEACPSLGFGRWHVPVGIPLSQSNPSAEDLSVHVVSDRIVVVTTTSTAIGEADNELSAVSGV